MRFRCGKCNGTQSRQFSKPQLLRTLCIVLLLAGACGAQPPDPPSGNRYALLIGCTKYDQNERLRLVGPANDLVLMRDLLRSRFRFPAANITELSDAARSNGRPTRRRIEQAFVELARQCNAGDQVVIFLAGHGSLQPEVRPDRENAKPDGLDEIFLPADVGRWDRPTARVSNAIADYEFRAWIQRILDKGAFVWSVVDACHAGSMLRGVPGEKSVEKVRAVRPDDLGIPEEAMDQARKKAAQRPKTPASDDAAEGGLAVAAKLPRNFVAVYACQTIESEIERPMPPDAAEPVQHGLLTYTLCQILKSTTRAMSYRELAQSIQSQYTRWGRPTGPVPYSEGLDVDRKVLEADGNARRGPGQHSGYRSNVGGPAGFRLHRGDGGGWWVDCGRLLGVAENSILAVHRPGEKEPEKPIGYVKITSSRTLDARVAPVEYAGVAAPSDAELEGGYCDPVYLALGSARLRLAVVPPSESRRGVDERALEELRQGLKTLSRGANCRFDLVGDRDRAEWVVRSNGGGLELLPADAARLEGPLAAGTPCFVLPAEEPLQAAGELADRIARVKNLQDLTGIESQTLRPSRKAGSEAADDEAAGVGVEFRMFKLGAADDKVGKPVLWGPQGIILKPGDWVAWRITNQGDVTADVTLFFIDSAYHIQAVFPAPGGYDNRLLAGKSLTFGPARINGKTTGAECMVLLAVKANGPPLDLTVLAKPTFDEASQSRGGPGFFDTSLGRLLRGSLFSDAQSRGATADAVDDYAAKMLSWRVTQ